MQKHANHYLLVSIFLEYYYDFTLHRMAFFIRVTYSFIICILCENLTHIGYDLVTGLKTEKRTVFLN